MEPISTAAIVTALGAGAAALLNGALGQAGQDAYQRLKVAVCALVSTDDVDKLAASPNSKARKDVIEEELTKADDQQASQLAELAKGVLDAIRSEQSFEAAGVSLEDIEAINIRLNRISAVGGGLRMKKVRARGDIDLSDVNADAQRPGKL